ncbi:hypothetical protein EMPS_05924 [Entomortierella parvispora]|uniref:Protein kinase domain-containing protein n=1 Tax=Entomortierella parvispora TaxID=205924 RepID=A0A9P3HBC2_9FUNG|nr:hypothetical protein EMPS_05924 [Entomortierella parvispora]
MGAAESKALANGAASAESSSKSKLTFPQGSTVLQTTPVYTLRDAFFGKRPVSAFTYDPAQFVVDNKQEFLPKAIKKLKTIRHPSVLRFIDCKTASAGVHLITERVIPLTVDYLEGIAEDEILLGLYDIMVALHFLHSQCHMSHNNVQLSSIFVSNGRWVLGGMEFTGTVAESKETGLTSILSKELVPPEHQNQGPSSINGDMDQPHAVDIWQYGKLVESLIQDGFLHIKPNAMPIDRMLDNDPRRRPSGDVVLESNLFTRNNAVSVVRYCRLKGLDKSQNAEWSRSILPKLHMLPSSIMEKFVLPQLLTQEFFAAEGFDKLYRTLFTPQPPQPLVSEELYRSQVHPFMIKLWTYRQADIRMTLFRLFEVYLKAVVMGEGGSEVLGQIVLPEILAGLQDADPKIFLASLSGLATAIPYALLVTTLEPDLTKLKFSVKSLYEQTLIPQIMVFWISEDNHFEAKAQLIEVVLGMWCSIYTLGLQSHGAVKDISATLTLTLVSVLKLCPVQERVDLISKSFTKHCTNGLFCISGLLKFLPQFLLDEDAQVREAAAAAISTVAHLTIGLVAQQEPGTEQDHSASQGQDAGSSSSSATTPISSPSTAHAAHVSRIRQYCEKQQTLLPARRPIFSRSTFASERSLSTRGIDLKGHNQSSSDLLSSRRSSMVSQDSFMMSEQGSLKTPAFTTPSLTRTGSFTTDASGRDTFATLELDAKKKAPVEMIPRERGAETLSDMGSVSSTVEVSSGHTDAFLDEPDHESEEDANRAAELELLKALEAAKAEMKARQLPVETVPAARKPNASASVPVFGTSTTKSTSSIGSNAAFGWDSTNGDEGDDWEADDLTTLNTPSDQSPSAPLQPEEDEATRKQREKAQAEKQEQLRQKRDQKQQEMQAKREARRQQLAEKQLQRKASSADTKPFVAAKIAPVPSPTPTPSASSTSLSSRPSSNKSVLQVPDDSSEEKDDWDMEADLDLGDLQKQAGPVEEELFKDLEVSYKAPAYVGAGPVTGSHTNGGLSGSTASISSSASSSATLSSSTTTPSKPLSSPTLGFKSALKTSTFSKTTTSTTSTTTNTSSTTVQGSLSGRSSPSSTPKRVASPLLRTASSSSSLNGLNKSTTIASLAPKPVPAAPAVIETIPSLAPQEITAEDDGWGDDWE